MVKTPLWCALLASGWGHAASLTAQLDRTTVALGEPVSLTVQAQGLSLDAFDAASLGPNIEVFGRTLSRGTDSETLVLTLYPRVAGFVSIPPLTLQGRRTAALSLKVTEGSDSVPRVTSTWTLAPANPQVNQPARLTLSICDDGSLQWQRPALPVSAGRIVRALGEEAGEEAGCTLQQYHWAMHATQAGPATLVVPMLDAVRFGQRLRFPGPALGFHAAALPAWLPAQVAPVRPVVAADPLPARWPLRRPLSWRIEVMGAYSADGLKSLLDLQLRDSPALGVYPPLIEAVAPDDLNSPLNRYVVTLFLMPHARGELLLPALRFPWYDRNTGQVASVALQARTLTLFDPRWQSAMRAAGGLGGLLLLAGVVWQVRRMARWRIARWRGLRAIRQARDAAELARAVRQFSLTGQAGASSFGDWVQRMQRETDVRAVADAVHPLQQQLFGQGVFTLDRLQQDFLDRLAGVRPKSGSV